MALQFQNVPINFGQGLDTKTDKKLVVPGKLTDLENGVFTSGDTITKRNGYDALSTDSFDVSPITAGDAIGVFNPSRGVEELIEISENRLLSYSPDQLKWKLKDSAYSVNLKYKNVYINQNDNLNADAAFNSDLEFYAWRDATGAYVNCTVVDSNTGVQVQLEEQLASLLGRPRLVSIGALVYLFYIKSGGDLVWRVISTTTPNTISGETVLATANTTSSALDVVSDGTNMWVVYYSSVNDIRMIKLNSAGASVATQTLAETIAATGTLTLAVNSNVFIYWFNGTDGFCYAVYDSSLVSVLGKTVIDSDIVYLNAGAGAVATSTTSQTVFYSKYPSATTSLDQQKAVTAKAVVSTAGITTAAATIIRSCRIATKPFLHSGVIYLWASHISTLQSTLILFDSDGVAIGKAYPGKTRGAGSFSFPTVVQRSASEWFHGQAIITKYTGELGTGIKSGIAAVTVDFNSANKYQKAMLGGNLHFTGGFLSAYDGKSVVECGFHFFPEDIANTPSTTGGSMADGTYQYSVVYEWVDNQGQVHRSAPSVAVSAIVSGGGGNGSVTLTIPTLRVTEKKGVAGEVAIQIYRTKAGQTTFFNVKPPTGSTLFNTTSADSVTYVDTVSDSVIGAYELLYTNGGILENIAPESCGMLDVYQNRMVISGLEDPLEYQYSKTQVEGEGVAFSDTFVGRVDPLGGEITAVKLMDDKIILFKNNNIFFVSGEGPNDAGGGNLYSVPSLITSDSGCPYPKSAVLMPLGIMYKSNKGIYLLTRGLQVEYIGADVEAYNSQLITGATLLQDKNQVRFVCSTGRALVYDYYFKQWSTFTNHTGLDSVVWKSNYCYLRTNGVVYQQNAGYQDAGSNVNLKPTTAWLKLAGIQGFQRVRRIGILANYKSAHSLRVRVYYDYDEVNYDEYTFNAASVIASAAVPYQFRVHLAQQKCEAIKFELMDTSGASLAEAYSISDLSLDVGIKGGINRLKAAQSI